MTLTRKEFGGPFTALVTPMKQGEVDIAAYERLVETQLAAGISGLVPVGTTGEAATLTDAEAALILQTTVSMAKGQALVIAGTGSNSTRITIEKSQKAQKAGADALLVVTPYYNKPTQDGLYGHYAAVAKSVDIPIVLYSVPGRTGVELSAQTCAALHADFSNIVAIKEAGGRIERITELRLACGEDFAIHSGDDAHFLPALSLGADGLTSVLTNILPEPVLEMYAAWRSNDQERARQLHDLLFDISGKLFIESNPAPVKFALAESKAMTAEVRLPLAELTEASRAVLRKSMDAFRQNYLAQRKNGAV